MHIAMLSYHVLYLSHTVFSLQSTIIIKDRYKHTTGTHTCTYLL